MPTISISTTSAGAWVSSQLPTSEAPSSPSTVTTLSILKRDSNRLFKSQNPSKTTGPESATPSSLKHCADQLSPVFTDIFNTSLETCMDSSGTYARIMFVDFSPAFNTIIPTLLQDKLSQWSVPDSTCRWITDVLSNRRQHVKLRKYL